MPIHYTDEGPERVTPAWVIVNRGGHPFEDTVRSTRRESIRAFQATEPLLHWTWNDSRREYGVRAVKCRLVSPVPTRLNRET